MTKYHLEAVPEVPEGFDGRKAGTRKSKLEKLLHHIADSQPGEWFLVGTYEARYGASNALRNLQERIDGQGGVDFKWEGRAVPFETEDSTELERKIHSRLYFRVLTDAQAVEQA